MESDTILLNSNMCCDVLTIPGNVVDRMLREANEAQLKIYLYLLRNNNRDDVTVSSIADYFNYTEQDVVRALRFINGKPSEGVKASKTEAKRNNVVEFSVRPHYSKEKIAEFAKIPEVSSLLFAAEHYKGKPLKSEEISIMLYIYDEFSFSADAIEYLIEDCLGKGITSFKDMAEVADAWHNAGVTDLTSAKRYTRMVPKEMPEVFAALGMDSSTQPIDAQVTYVRKWTESYGYGMDIIRIALERTILAINKPSFKYANSIIKGWHDAKVVTIADILAEDEKYKAKKANSGSDGAKAMAGKVSSIDAKSKGMQKGAPKGATGSRYSNFDEREYDYDLLMKDILSN